MGSPWSTDNRGKVNYSPLVFLSFLVMYLKKKIKKVLLMFEDVFLQVNLQREAQGFLSIEAILGLQRNRIVVLNPFATFISKHVHFSGSCQIGSGAILMASAADSLVIEDGVTFAGNVEVEAINGGKIRIGNNAAIGHDGGFSIKANRSNAVIQIGENARLMGGGALYGKSIVGDGAQILGSIKVQDCILDGGGNFEEADPGLRGAVLKGMGWANGLKISRGQVIQACGDFSLAPVRQQVEFHSPKATSQ